MAEPTSVLTFGQLIVETARKIGVAYYGEDGDTAAQAPVDVHDLSEVKRHVNNAIRMFIADAPANGWRWCKPTAQITLWPSVAVAAANLIASGGYDPGTNKTTLTVTDDSFYESMEEHTITLTGVGTFTIADYVAATSIRVSGNASAAGAGVTWSLTANGNYTLPRTFGGSYSGQVGYAAATGRARTLDWTSEAVVRSWREDSGTDTGDPYWMAVRPMSSGTPRRRWELLAYPLPDAVLVVEFQYDLHFDSLIDTDEVPPSPFSHDETIKAACLAVVEKDVEGVLGSDWDYYRNTGLANSHRIDRMSAPRRLGYFGSGGGSQRLERLRPNVTFNT